MRMPFQNDDNGICMCGEYVRDHGAATDPWHSPVIMEEPPMTHLLDDARHMIGRIIPAAGGTPTGDVLRIGGLALYLIPREGYLAAHVPYLNDIRKLKHGDLPGWANLIRTRFQEKAIKTVHEALWEPFRFVPKAALPDLLEAVRVLDDLGLTSEDVIADLKTPRYVFIVTAGGRRHYIELESPAPDGTPIECGHLCLDRDPDRNAWDCRVWLKSKGHPLKMKADIKGQVQGPFEAQTWLINTLIHQVLAACRKHNAKKVNLG